MLVEDGEKLGEVALEWWNKLLDHYAAAKKAACPDCVKLIEKIQEIRPHRNSEHKTKDNAAKKKAVRSNADSTC